MLDSFRSDPVARRLATSRHRGVTESAREELLDLRRRLEAQLLPQLRSEHVELAYRFGHVADAEVGLDQEPVGAFAQGICVDRREGGDGRLRVALRRDERIPGHVQRKEAQLAESLALVRDPVVIPIGQKLAALRESTKVSLSREWIAVEDVVCACLEFADVGGDRAVDREVCARHLDDAYGEEADPPESRPQASVGVVLVVVDPKATRDVRALERPVLEREKRDELLRVGRKGECAAARLERKASEEGESSRQGAARCG